MITQDYVWVVVERKKTRSTCKSKHKASSRSKSKIKASPYLEKKQQNASETQRIRELERQNMILRKQNSILSEYFYNRQYELQSPRPPQPSRDELVKKQGSIYFQSQQKDKADVSTLHSEKLPKKLLNFGAKKK